ncbi:hypothetical protein JCM3774_001072 [Rhodotorula dairenensis]
MSSTSAYPSSSLTATSSVATTGSGEFDQSGPIPANWVVLCVVGAILVPFLLVGGGIACVSLRRSIRRARVRKLKTAIDGDAPSGCRGGSGAASRWSGHASGSRRTTRESPERKSSPGTRTSPLGMYPVVVGEPLRRNGSELRRASLESVDIASGPAGVGEENGEDSLPAYRTTPAGTPAGRAL